MRKITSSPALMPSAFRYEAGMTTRPLSLTRIRVSAFMCHAPIYVTHCTSMSPDVQDDTWICAPRLTSICQLVFVPPPPPRAPRGEDIKKKKKKNTREYGFHFCFDVAPSFVGVCVVV